MSHEIEVVITITSNEGILFKMTRYGFLIDFTKRVFLSENLQIRHGYLAVTPLEDKYKKRPGYSTGVCRTQELGESRDGRPGLPSLIRLRFLWTQSNTLTTSTGCVSRFGLTVRRQAGKRKDLGSNSLRLSFLLKSCGLWTLSCAFVPPSS